MNMNNKISTLQLKNTAWPKFHHDLKNSGQSPYTSYADGTIKWYINFPDKIRGTPAIDTDGTIYIGMVSGFYAINPDGTIKWSYLGEWVGSEYSSPAIDQNGIIYNFGLNGLLYAFDQDGNLVWSFNTYMYGYSGPAIGLDGNIYIGGSGYDDPWTGIFIAIDPNGNEIWRYTTNDHGIPIETPISGTASNYSPAISPTDGTIYIKIEEGPYVYLVAFSPNGDEKWRITIGSWWSRAICPVIGPDETIYIPGSDGTTLYMYAITDNITEGIIKWQYTIATGDSIHIEDIPAIATDVTIYIGATYDIGGTYYYNKYAITDNGNSATLKWSFSSPTEVRSPAIIGSDGTIYFGSGGNGGIARFYALNPNDGSIKWFKDLAANNIVGSPSMSSDGTIYIGTDGIYDDTSSPSLVTFQPSVLENCPSTPKYSGDTINLSAAPNGAIGPYHVRFWRMPASGAINSLSYGEIGSVRNVTEGSSTSTSFTLYDTDLVAASGNTTAGIPTTGPTGAITDPHGGTAQLSAGKIRVATTVYDSCPTGAQSCISYCDITLGCVAPTCNFTVI